MEEAGPPEGGDEPLEIAWRLSELAATQPRMRVVATATKQLAREAESGEEVDLDQQNAEDDMVPLAARLLVEPYVSDRETAVVGPRSRQMRSLNASSVSHGAVTCCSG
ncbi:hypothetical protein [Streptomyces sp. NBC_01538]|uniref:hypothetical protein n=1 Tax=Streptomyces sp. NBC_01538 TaxID=2903897 RepID=UPI00386BE854